MAERSLADYLRILRERWLWLVVPLLLSLAMAALYTARTQETYRSSVKLYVGATSWPNAETGIQADTLAQRRVASYADLLNGRRISDLVAARFGTRPEIHAEVVTDTVLIRVNVVDTSPTRARAIADFIGPAFVTFLRSLERPRGGDSLRVTLVEPANLPTQPLQPPLPVNLGVGLLVGLIAGVGVALLRNSVDRTIRHPWDLETAFRLPVLGEVARSRRLRRHAVPVLDDPRSAFAEDVRQLRASLTAGFLDPGRRVLVVTSPTAGAGTTSVSVNLAVALAMTGLRVVLVDAHLRRPAVAATLGLPASQGLSELLSHPSRAMGDLLHKWRSTGLQVLSAGGPADNPSDLLATERTAAVFESLRQGADIVIVDTPAVLLLSDTSVLAKLADGVLLVVRHGRTTDAQLEAALKSLRRMGASALGFVLTAVPMKGHAQRRQARQLAALETPRRTAPSWATPTERPPHIVDVDDPGTGGRAGPPEDDRWAPQSADRTADRGR